MGSVLFYSIPVGFCAGIFLRSLFPFPGEVVPLLLIMSFTLAVIWRRNAHSVSSPLLLGSVFLLCTGLGLLRFDLAASSVSMLQVFENTEVALEGVVVREPDVRSSVRHLYIKEIGSGTLFLATADPYVRVSYGDRVIVEGLLERPESFEGELGRTFNYEGYLQSRGVTQAIFRGDVSILAHDEGNPVIAFLLTVKERFTEVLEMIIPEPQVGLAEGLLLGMKRALGEDLEALFVRAGIVHIVVLSGYNLMIVADALMRILSFFFRPFARMIFGILVIAAFAIMVGLSATVVRASIMAALVLFARATGRTGNALRALSVAGIVMLLINPYLLVFDPGFELSFLATLGLILISPLLERFFVRVPTMFKIREYLVATIATQIAVLPLLLYLMGAFSVVAVFVNVLVLPMVPVAMGLAFLTGAIGSLVPALGMFVGFVANLALAYIVAVATLLGSLPFASFTVPAFPFWVVVVGYGLLVYFLWVLYAHLQGKSDPVRDGQESLNDWEIVSMESFLAQTNEPGKARSALPGSFPFR